MIQDSPAIEDNLFDAEISGPFADGRADRPRLRGLVFPLELAVKPRFESRRSGERPTNCIVEYLGLEGLQAPKDSKARTLGRAVDLTSHPVMPPDPLLNIR